MEESYIKQHLLIDDYLAGRLSDAALARFEERLLWDEALIEEVAVADALRQGLKDAALSLDQRAGAADGPKWRNRLWAPRLAVAASVLLAVSLTFNVIQISYDTPDVTPEIRAARTPQIVRLRATRSTTPADVLVDPDAWVVLTTDSIAGFDDYEIRVASMDDLEAPISVESFLGVVSAQPLAIGLPGAQLPPGDYQLLVAARRSGDADYRPVSEVRFRVGTQD